MGMGLGHSSAGLVQLLLTIGHWPFGSTEFEVVVRSSSLSFAVTEKLESIIFQFGN
jgi:hypothetical protein